MKAPLPWDEYLRLKELWSYNILDSEQEKSFDELTDLAAHICSCPIASITFIDKERQWFKSKKGLEANETTRDVAFCAHTIVANDTMVVEDALNDERFADNPLVTGGMNIRFYAGAPIYSATGFKLGSVCVIDNKPRTISPQQVEALRIISGQITNLLELKLKNQKLKKEAEKLLLEQAQKSRNYTTYFQKGVQPQFILDETNLQIIEVNEACQNTFGYTRDELLNLDAFKLIRETDVTELKAIAAAALHHDKPFEKKVWLQPKAGEQQWVKLSGLTIFYQDRIGILLTVIPTASETSITTVNEEGELQDLSLTSQPNTTDKKVREIIHQELHHHISQVLTGTRLFLELAQTSEEMKDRLIDRCKDSLSHTTNEIDTLFTLLTTPSPVELNLITAIEALIESYTSKEPFDIFFIYRGDIEKLPPHTKFVLFRAVQDQLKNITQHANASHVWIHIIIEENIELNIKDDGQGYAPSLIKEGSGYRRIKDSVTKYNGNLDIVTSPDKGCYIRMALPFE